MAMDGGQQWWMEGTALDLMPTIKSVAEEKENIGDYGQLLALPLRNPGELWLAAEFS